MKILLLSRWARSQTQKKATIFTFITFKKWLLKDDFSVETDKHGYTM